MPIKQVTRWVPIWNAFALSYVRFLRYNLLEARGILFLFYMTEELQAGSLFIFVKGKSIDYGKQNISK